MTISITSPTSTTSKIQQNGNDVLTVDSSNNVTVINNLSVSGNLSGDVALSGNPSISGNLTVSGTTTATGAITGTGGIYLGGTASANLLDDYETGTWTPRFYRSTDLTELNVTTYNSEWGIYQRVGQWVTVQCELSTSNSTSVGTPGGNLLIGPLPFTAAVTGQYSANATGFAKRFGTDNQPRSVLIIGGEAFARPYRVNYTTQELDEACSANISAFTGEYNRTMFQITYPITGS